MYKASVKIVERQLGGVDVFVADDATDSFVKLTVSRAFGTLRASMCARGNFDAKDRPAQWAKLAIPAPDVSPEELDYRRMKAGLPTLRPATEEVGVALCLFASPREAFQHALDCPSSLFTYDALKSLKLTIGDRVVCPVGIINGPTQREIGGTVVSLAPRPAPCAKRLIEWKWLDNLDGCGKVKA